MNYVHVKKYIQIKIFLFPVKFSLGHSFTNFVQNYLVKMKKDGVFDRGGKCN